MNYGATLRIGSIGFGTPHHDWIDGWWDVKCLKCNREWEEIEYDKITSDRTDR